MATKKLKKKVQRKTATRKAENPVLDSARDIWLAGLGAFAVAQQEGEKFIEESNKLFDKLVREGTKLEKQTRKDVEGAFDDVRGEFETRMKGFRGDVESRVKDIRGEVETRVTEIRDDIEDRLGVRKQRAELEKRSDDMRKQATEGWDKLESFFEERVARVLTRLGIPTRGDIDRLNRRVQELSRTVADLEKSSKPKRAAKKAARKPAAKKAAKKTVARKAVKKAGVKKAAVKKATVKKAAVKKAAVKKAAAKKTAPAKAAAPASKAA
jgi:poly(hydroxyalkanoate) granule-associated protein